MGRLEEVLTVLCEGTAEWKRDNTACMKSLG